MTTSEYYLKVKDRTDRVMRVRVVYFGPVVAIVTIRYARFQGSKPLNYALPIASSTIEQVIAHIKRLPVKTLLLALILSAAAAHADTILYDKNGQYLGRAVEISAPMEEPAARSYDLSGLSTIGAPDSGLQFKSDVPPAVEPSTVPAAVDAAPESTWNNTPGYVDGYALIDEMRRKKGAAK